MKLLTLEDTKGSWVQIPSGPNLQKMEKKESFNIFEHVLVPKHVILNAEEISNLLKKFNIALNQLPRISSKDPAVKVLNAKPGDVIKILRKSETAGISEFYRIVVGEE